MTTHKERAVEMLLASANRINALEHELAELRAKLADREAEIVEMAVELESLRDERAAMDETISEYQRAEREGIACGRVRDASAKPSESPSQKGLDSAPLAPSVEPVCLCYHGERCNVCAPSQPVDAQADARTEIPQPPSCALAPDALSQPAITPTRQKGKA